jgi:hypothetical protein
MPLPAPRQSGIRRPASKGSLTRPLPFITSHTSAVETWASVAISGRVYKAMSSSNRI